MVTARECRRISLKNILITTDFSPAASAALPFAKTFAEMYDARLFMAHALPPEPRRQVVMDAFPSQYDRQWERAKEELREVAQHTQVESAGEKDEAEHTPIKTILERGALEEIIPRITRDHHIDLVVLGTAGHRGVAKVFFGSDAEKIYRSATCPVLTVGPKVRQKATGESGSTWEIKHILFPVDLSEDPTESLHWALSLAEENQANLILLTAEELVPWQHRTTVEEQLRRRLESLIPAEAKDWCEPQYLVSWDYPPDAILHVAQDWAIDLIVMGVHRARVAALSSHMPWPVASEVVSRAPCPVLTVRI